MTRPLCAIAVAVLAAGGASAADPPAPTSKLLGKWALPGKGKLRWEVFADGSLTGTADGKPVFHPAASAARPSVSFVVGKADEEGVVDVTFTVRASDQTGDAGTYKAKVEFTRAGRMTVRYAELPKDAGRYPPPFPDGKKLYRPEDVKD